VRPKDPLKRLTFKPVVIQRVTTGGRRWRLPTLEEQFASAVRASDRVVMKENARSITFTLRKRKKV
jgi:hypothetical protein